MAEELFGEMWEELEVPSSPSLSLSSISTPLSSSIPSIPSLSSSSSVLLSSSNTDINNNNYTNNNNNNNEIQTTLISPTLNTSSTPSTKKRKTPAKDTNETNTTTVPHTWQEYSFGPQTYPIFDILSFERMSENIDVSAQIVNPNCFYSQQYSAWVCYRQNQFKVFCLYQGPDVNSLCLNDKGIPRKVEGMYAKIYGVKEVAGVYGDGMRVGLHKVGRKRLKSAKNEVDITPFVKGKIEFSNLQFEKSNSAKKPLPQTEYFHIVLILYAKCDGNMFPVLSKISSKIIVRGQNPGFYKDDEIGTTNARIFAFPQHTMDTTENDSNSSDSTNNSPSPSSSPSPSPSPVLSLQSSLSSSPSSVSTSISTTSSVSTTSTSSTADDNINNNIITSVDSSIYPPSSFSLSLSQSLSQIPPLSSSIPQFDFSMMEDMIKKSNIETSLQKKDIDASWIREGNNICHFGRVGINTAIPMEALTVHGNIQKI